MIRREADSLSERTNRNDNDISLIGKKNIGKGLFYFADHLLSYLHVAVEIQCLNISYYKKFKHFPVKNESH